MGVGKVDSFRKDEEEEGGFLHDTPLAVPMGPLGPLICKQTISSGCNPARRQREIK